MIHTKRLAHGIGNFIKQASRYGHANIVFKDIAQSSYYKPIKSVQDFLNDNKIIYQNGEASYRLK